MPTTIHNRLTSLATWPVVLPLLVGCLACRLGFECRQRALQGTDAPDVRGWYTPDEISGLFTGWGHDGRVLYAWTEVTLDLAFPLLYGTLFAAPLARLFRVGRGRWVVAVPLAGVAADLLENVTAATLAWTFDEKQRPTCAWTTACHAAACFTAVKSACFVGSLLLIMAGGLAGLWGNRPMSDTPS